MSRLIVGFTGASSSGKTTAALELIKYKNFQCISMEEPLKAMLRALGLTKEEIDGPLKEKPCMLLGGATPRRARKTLKLEWGQQSICPDVWVKGWRRLVDSVPEHNIVCDDVRSINEMETIKNMGGIIVHISRPTFDDGIDYSIFSHLWDTLIENENSLEEFKETIRKII